MGALIVVTGAAGFLGRATVAAALARGHRVRAVMRRVVAMPDGAEVMLADLAQEDLAPVMAGADAVIHAAASLTGDGETLTATRAVLAAAGNARFVLVSSMTVYGAGMPGGTIDEASPPEPAPHLRDAYCRMKLAQEAMLRDIRADGWMLRPGVIVGPGRLWNAHLGMAAGPFLLRAGAGQIPMIAVDDCARALVLAAETPPAGIEVVNVVADDLPDRRGYLALLQERPRIILPLHWRVPDAAAALLADFAPRLPGLLRRPTLRARLMPQTYANHRLHDRLDWQQEMPLAQAIRHAQGGA